MSESTSKYFDENGDLALWRSDNSLSSFKEHLDEITGPNAYEVFNISANFLKWASNKDGNVNLRRSAYLFMDNSDKDTYDGNDHSSHIVDEYRDKCLNIELSELEDDEGQVIKQKFSFGSWTPKNKEELSENDKVLDSDEENEEINLNEGKHKKKKRKKSDSSLRKDALSFLLKCLKQKAERQSSLPFDDGRLAYRLFFRLYDDPSLDRYKTKSTNETNSIINEKPITNKKPGIETVESLLPTVVGKSRLTNLLKHESDTIHETLAKKLFEDKSKSSIEDLLSLIDDYDLCQLNGPILNFREIKSEFSIQVLLYYVTISLADAVINSRITNISLINKCIDICQDYYKKNKNGKDIYSEPLKILDGDQSYQGESITLRELYPIAICSIPYANKDLNITDNQKNPYTWTIEKLLSSIGSPFFKKSFISKWEKLKSVCNEHSVGMFCENFKKFILRHQVEAFINKCKNIADQNNCKKLLNLNGIFKDAKFYLNYHSFKTEFSDFENCCESFDKNICVIRSEGEALLITSDISFSELKCEKITNKNEADYLLSPYNLFITAPFSVSESYHQSTNTKVDIKVDKDVIKEIQDNIKDTDSRLLDDNPIHFITTLKYVFNIDQKCIIDLLKNTIKDHKKELVDYLCLFVRYFSMDDYDTQDKKSISRAHNFEYEELKTLFNRGNYFIQNGYFSENTVKQLTEKLVEFALKHSDLKKIEKNGKEQYQNLKQDLTRKLDSIFTIKDIFVELSEKEDWSNNLCFSFSSILNEFAKTYNYSNIRFSPSDDSNSPFVELLNLLTYIFSKFYEVEKELSKSISIQFAINEFSSFLNKILHKYELGDIGQHFVANYIKKCLCYSIYIKHKIYVKSLYNHILLKNETTAFSDKAFNYICSKSKLEDEIKWIEYIFKEKEKEDVTVNQTGKQFSEQKFPEIFTNSHICLEISLPYTSYLIAYENEKEINLLYMDNSKTVKKQFKFKKEGIYLEETEDYNKIQVAGNFTSFLEAALNTVIVILGIKKIKNKIDIKTI